MPLSGGRLLGLLSSPLECLSYGRPVIDMSECLSGLWAVTLLLSMPRQSFPTHPPTRFFSFLPRSSSWPSVVLAFFLRYPSPISPHIVSVDTVSRRVDVETCRIYTERLILKKGAASALPKWFPKGVLGKTESWVYERSCVDPISRECEVLTRNLDHRRVMDVWEDLDITLAHPDAEPDGGKAQLPAASQERHLHE